MPRRHQPRHHARADVLERERRTVKQLERVDARRTSTSGIGKFSASTTTASSVAGSRSPRANGRSARSAISVSERRDSRAISSSLHGSIVSGTYRPPSGASPANSAVREGHRRRAAAGGYELHVGHDARAVRSDRRHVGLRLAADVLPDGRGHRGGDGLRRRRIAAQREQRRPRAGQAAAERARIRGRLLDLREARDQRRAPRLGNRVLERSRQLIEVRTMERVDERAEVRPLPDRVAERHLRAEQRSRARGLDLEIGMDDDRGQTGRHRQADDVGRIRRRARARNRRRPPGRCCRRARSRRRCARLRTRRPSASPAAGAR